MLNTQRRMRNSTVYMTFVVGTVLEAFSGLSQLPSFIPIFSSSSSSSSSSSPPSHLLLLLLSSHYEKQDSSVGIAMSLDSRGISVRFPAWARDFSFLNRGKTGSDAHQSSYPMGTEGSGCEAKHSTSSSVEVEMRGPNLHFSVSLWRDA